MAVMVACVAACASSATEQHEYDDPFEGYNRAMFSFNYQVDKYVIKPVAEGYRAVTTPFIRERISSVIDNLKSRFLPETICCRLILKLQSKVCPVL